MPPSSQALLVGLSGPSSSGKTTIARLLRSIFSNTLILHEDDFYKAEEDLPMRAGLRDWDCAGALDMPALSQSLKHMKEHAELPKDLESKEDQNEVGESGVSAETVDKLRREVNEWAREQGVGGSQPETNTLKQIFIIDGFLLFGKSVQEVCKLLDVKIMLRTTYQSAKRRREARSGYVTLEGFWEDPPEYVDKVVWPGYVEEHSFLFKEGNVEGEVDDEVVQELGLNVCPGLGDRNIEEMLYWVVDRIKEAIIP